MAPVERARSESARRVGRRIERPPAHWSLLALLRRLGVPATFFMVGEHVVEHADLVADLEDEGFELGDHTFNHVHLSGMPGWEQHLQVSMTDAAIVGAAGVRPRFFRPPYSGGPESITRTYA